VGCPTSFHKEHCLPQYTQVIKSLTYPNYDILLVDNSKDDTYLKKIQAQGLPAVKGPYYEGARDRIVHSRNILREKALEQGYDYFLSLEQDVIPPRDVIERMLSHTKPVISGVYFNRIRVNGISKLTPLNYKLSKKEPGKLPSMKPLNEADLSTNKLLETISAGVGCLLIHNTVLKKVKFRYEGAEAFDDRFFFIDLYNLKIKAYTDTSLKCVHFILNRPHDWSNIKK